MSVDGSTGCLQVEAQREECVVGAAVLEEPVGAVVGTVPTVAAPVLPLEEVWPLDPVTRDERRATQLPRVPTCRYAAGSGY